jgi:hypothetical protein
MSVQLLAYYNEHVADQTWRDMMGNDAAGDEFVLPSGKRRKLRGTQGDAAGCDSPVSGGKRQRQRQGRGQGRQRQAEAEAEAAGSPSAPTAADLAQARQELDRLREMDVIQQEIAVLKQRARQPSAAAAAAAQFPAAQYPAQYPAAPPAAAAQYPAAPPAAAARFPSPPQPYLAPYLAPFPGAQYPSSNPSPQQPQPSFQPPASPAAAPQAAAAPPAALADAQFAGEVIAAVYGAAAAANAAAAAAGAPDIPQAQLSFVIANVSKATADMPAPPTAAIGQAAAELAGHCIVHLLPGGNVPNELALKGMIRGFVAAATAAAAGH